MVFLALSYLQNNYLTISIKKTISVFHQQYFCIIKLKKLEYGVSMLKKYQTLSLILLFYIIVLAFYPSISADFIMLDDPIMIKENPYITNLSISNIKNIFTSIYLKLYHPIVTLTFAIEYSICKLDPYLYHIDNILLHLFNTLFIFFIIKNLSKNFFVSYSVAIFFAIYPTSVETVAWVTARKDTLYSFFFLLSILFYLKKDEYKYIKIFSILSIFSFLLSCMSKPTAVTLPLVLMLIDFCKNKLNFKFNSIKKYVPFFIISFIFICIAIYSHYSPEEKEITTIFVRYINFLDAHFHILFYIYKFIFPINFSCLYPQFYNHYNIIPLYVLYSPTILYTLIYFFIFTLKFNKKNFFGFFWFLITILPSSGVMPIGVSPVADRYTYIPYVGLFYIIANLLYIIYTRKQYLSIFFILVIAIVLFNATYKQNILWTNNINLMTQAINYSPNKAGYAYLNRGIIYKAENKLQLAETDLTKSYSINKNNTYINFHLANLKQLQKKFIEAKKLYYHIPKGSNDYIDTIANLGLILSEENKTKVAIKMMKDTLKENLYVPDYFFYILAHICYKEESIDEAIEYIKIAINKKPSNSIYYLTLMNFFDKKHNFIDFEKTAIDGLKKTNNNFEISNKLTEFYFKNKKYLNAENLSIQSIKLYPINHFAYFILGNISAIRIDYKKALFFYTMAIFLSTNSGEYYFKRAVAWYMLKNYNQAKKNVEKAEKYNFIVDDEFKKNLETLKRVIHK